MPYFDLVALFSDHLAFIAVVFFALFLILCSLFAASDLVPMMRGMGSVVASVFVSPFVYLKRAIIELANYGKHGDKILGSTDQYLIHKILLILRAMTVIVSIGVLSAALVVGWYAMLPPEPLRLQIGLVQQEIEKEKVELATETSNLAHMDADWQSRRVALVDQRRTELTQNHQDAIKSIDQIIQEISAQPQGDAVLANVRSLLEVNAYGSQELNKSRLQQEIAQANLPDQLKAELGKFVESWYEERNSRQELAALTENSARASVQPDWQDTRDKVDQLTRSISATEQDLTQLQAQAVYHPEELLRFAVLGLAEFLGVVWFWGVLCESIGLAVHVATDVKCIRQTLYERVSPSKPASETVLEGG